VVLGIDSPEGVADVAARVGGELIVPEQAHPGCKRLRMSVRSTSLHRLWQENRDCPSITCRSSSVRLTRTALSSTELALRTLRLSSVEG
jgi:hypothetical protein